MPWDHCARTLADDATCPCGVTKAQWTVDFQVTRQFRVTTGRRQVRVTVVDAADLPVPCEPFVVTRPDGVEVAAACDEQGAGRVPSATPGTYGVRFPRRVAADVVLAPLDDEGEGATTAPGGDGPARFEVEAGRRLRVRMRLANARWDREEARVGDEVALSVSAAFPDGTEVAFAVLEHDADGQHDEVETLTARVEGSVARASWRFQALEDVDDEASEAETAGGYTAPEYLFRATSQGCSDTSGLLRYRDWFELKVRGHDGGPAVGVEVTLTLRDGETRAATTDAQGVARWEGVAPGAVRWSFRKPQPDQDDHEGRHVHHGAPDEAPDASHLP